MNSNVRKDIMSMAIRTSKKQIHCVAPYYLHNNIYIYSYIYMSTNTYPYV
ncbi:hypothetical protein CLV51_103454 [Chitinophaga niastensis]|uniref:Uncharacterized protein n=1 Tax=Chitinophaga niastensis TaxID=536980 RepID=A0A2P8HJU5_CHINA|nr:hypothetical protein CLV51_103454 [Chitinophaga niastensis]